MCRESQDGEAEFLIYGGGILMGWYEQTSVNAAEAEGRYHLPLSFEAEACYASIHHAPAFAMRTLRTLHQIYRCLNSLIDPVLIFA